MIAEHKQRSNWDSREFVLFSKVSFITHDIGKEYTCRISFMCGTGYEFGPVVTFLKIEAQWVDAL